MSGQATLLGIVEPPSGYSYLHPLTICKNVFGFNEYLKLHIRAKILLLRIANHTKVDPMNQVGFRVSPPP